MLGKSLGHAGAGAAALRARRPRLPMSAPRLRHAAGRSGEPRAGGDRAEDPRARRALRRGRRARRERRRRRAARQLPRPRLRLGPARSSGGASTPPRCDEELQPRPDRRPDPHDAAALDPRRAGRAAARVPLLLWFTHWKPSRTLLLAERVSTAVLSVDRRSFPLRSSKVVAIGHGIDLARFPSWSARADRPAARGRARPHVAGEGLRDDRARCRRSPASISSCAARRSPTRSRPSGARLEGARGTRGGAGTVRRRSGPAGRARTCS